jgi:hypothetical protein
MYPTFIQLETRSRESVAALERRITRRTATRRYRAHDRTLSRLHVRRARA